MSLILALLGPFKLGLYDTISKTLQDLTLFWTVRTNTILLTEMDNLLQHSGHFIDIVYMYEQIYKVICDSQLANTKTTTTFRGLYGNSIII
jgi:hypothetical protein